LLRSLEEIGGEELDFLLDREFGGIQDEVGVLRFFELGTDAREIGDFACTGSFVEAFGVALLAGCEVGAQVDRDEGFADDLADGFSGLFLGSDEAGDDDGAAFRKEACDMGGPAEIFGSVVL